MKRRKTVRAVVFVLLCAMLFGAVQKVVGKPANSYGYQLVKGFYKEKKNSLDAVYIGASNVFMFWEAPLAWGHYGITVWPFASDAQSFTAAEYLIREARKTQPDALYIIGLNNLESGNVAFMHELVDYMPMNGNRFHIIDQFGNYFESTMSERLELYFPLIRFHARWSELRDTDYCFVPDGLKGGNLNRNIEDISDKYFSSDERKPLPKKEEQLVEKLFEYCDREHVKVLFVTAPRATDPDFLGRLNTVCDLARSHGYPVLDMQPLCEEIGLDFTTDYYNAGHVNIHGALKITEYLAQYLVDNYEFSDKRGTPNYSEWNEAYSKYIDFIAPFTLPFEYEPSTRDYTLAAPKVTKDEGNLFWEAIDKADGYGIFQKTGADQWNLVTVVGSDVLQYRDYNYSENARYTVVPFVWEKLNFQCWGKYDMKSLKE